MTQDDYGEVTNSQVTYDQIAYKLTGLGRVLIGWTDGMMSHFDILFVLGVDPIFGNGVQGGIQPKDLFVSIMRRGAFGFDITQTDTHAGYYAEKLNVHEGLTTDALAELINNVKKAIINEK